MLLYVHRDYVRTIRDGEPRTASSTFTQLLSSVILEKKQLIDLWGLPQQRLSSLPLPRTFCFHG